MSLRSIHCVIGLVSVISGCGESISTVPKLVPPSTSTGHTSPLSPVRDPVDLEAGSKSLGDYVTFPACGIKIRKPSGYEKADGFDGFQIPDMLSSISAVKMNAPYSKVAPGFTAEKMRAQGCTMHSREDIKVDDVPGILIHFEQPVEFEVFLKWGIIFGDEKKTTLVIAACADDQAKEMAPRLKAAVLSTRLDSGMTFDPEKDLPFSVAASPKLKFTPSVSKTLSYSKDGVFPSQSRKDPAFFVTTGIGAPENTGIPGRVKYVEQMLHQTGKLKQMLVKSSQAVTIDGLDGVELQVEGDDAKSGDAMTIHQTILFNGDTHYVLLGISGKEFKDEYFPVFQAMAGSFKRRLP